MIIHVQQLMEEGHLRWDSLGEFCALSASLDFLGQTKKNPKALILSKALVEAIENLLDENKSPSRKVGEIDNRGSHYFIAKYWAQALSEQNDDSELKTYFNNISNKLTSNQKKIEKELLKAQGSSVSLGGYYHTSKDKVRSIMRPSPTLNEIIG